MLELLWRREQNWRSAAKEGEVFSSGWSSFLGRLEVLECAWVVIMKREVEKRLLLLQGCFGFQQELHSVTGVINPLLIVNVFLLYFMKLQTSKQFDECMCIMRCSNIINLKN